MALDEIKSELVPTPEPYVETALLSSSVMTADEVPVAEPIWRNTEGHGGLQVVEINEKAAKHGHMFLENVQVVLERFQDEILSCDTRLAEISRFTQQ